MMTPPNWHQTVLELAHLRFSELPALQRSRVRLLFIKHGQIHCRTFIPDTRDADEPGTEHFQIWKRIDDLKDTPGEAYAVVSLMLWNDPSEQQTLAMSVQGAERNDPHETEWLQRVTIDPDSGQITGHECWIYDLPPRANAFAPY